MDDDDSSLEGGEPSELGTKNFWDKQYELELENFLDHGDIGEIWFGKRIMDTIVKWVTDTMDKENCNILDLGCGNGILLIHLAEKGFKKLTGVDYSDAAIDLAKTIADSRRATISYETMDVLRDISLKTDDEKAKKYDLLLDKGTYDAVSLMEGFGPEVRNRYLDATADLLKSDGVFLIATCNWTDEEITQQMLSHYRRIDALPTPVLQFGGKQGNNVSVVLFRKK